MSVYNGQYGIKEVADLVLIDVETNKPVIFFDTLKVSNIENASENVSANGGQGNPTLMTWDFGRTATLSVTDALLSDQSLSLLAGTKVQTEDITIYRRETFSKVTDKVSLKHLPVANTINVFVVEDGQMADEVSTFTPETKDLTFTPALESVSIVVYYESVAEADSARKVVFNGSAFPSVYKAIGWTVVRTRKGVDEKMQFVIHKAQLKTENTITLDPENPSTFDFNFEVLAQEGTKDLYELIRYV